MKNPFLEGYGSSICKNCFDKLNLYHLRVSDHISVLREALKKKDEKIRQLQEDVKNAEKSALSKLGLQRIPELEENGCSCCD